MKVIQSLPVIKFEKNLQKPRFFPFRGDCADFENPKIDKSVFVNRGIIGKNENINDFFDNFSKKIFQDSKKQQELSYLLKNGFVSFSSNIYSDLENPKSALGVVLDDKKSSSFNLEILENSIAQGFGVGVNFSNFDEPQEEIKKINAYFKLRSPFLKRPAAGIALLNINHPKILDFITLKDKRDYENWCFDLSVVLDDEFLSKVDKNEEITLLNGEKLPATAIYSKLLSSMLKSGEPGVIFSNDKNYITDPCAATPLKPNEGLTIAQINLSKFYDSKKNEIDYSNLRYCSKILSLAMQNIDRNGFIGVLGYQDLLNKMNLKYGSKKGDEILKNCLEIIKKETSSKGIKTAISPTGTISRVLKTTPSIEPQNQNLSYKDEIKTLALAQKYIDGSISKTISLKKDATADDVDKIVRTCAKSGVRGITVFRG